MYLSILFTPDDVDCHYHAVHDDDDGSNLMIARVNTLSLIIDAGWGDGLSNISQMAANNTPPTMSMKLEAIHLLR